MIKLLALMYFLTGTKSDIHINIAQAVKDNCLPQTQHIALLIAFKESSLTLNECLDNTNGTNDCGIFQINSIHGISRDDRLDIEKAGAWACRRLNSLYENAPYDKAWFAEYHSVTKDKKEAYYKAVWRAYGRSSV